MPPPSLGTTLPAWVLSPQLGYYPPSLSTTTLPASVLLPPEFLNSSSEGGIGHALDFRAFLLLSQVSSMYYLVRNLMVPVTLSRCYPPRFYDFLEELVVGDGVKTLGLHLRATCRSIVLLIFGSIYCRSYIIVYTDSLIFPRYYYYLCSSKPIELGVGLLLEYC